jgi:hypothetical protein
MEPRSAQIRAATAADAAALAALSGALGYPSTEQRMRKRLRLLDDPERGLLCDYPL